MRESSSADVPEEANEKLGFSGGSVRHSSEITSDPEAGSETIIGSRSFDTISVGMGGDRENYKHALCVCSNTF